MPISYLPFICPTTNVFQTCLELSILIFLAQILSARCFLSSLSESELLAYFDEQSESKILLLVLGSVAPGYCETNCTSPLMAFLITQVILFSYALNTLL